MYTKRLQVHFGRQVRLARKRDNLTLDELANITGLDSKHISRLENGKKLMNLRTLAILKRELDLNIDQIMEEFFRLKETEEIEV
ncbi:helix-turn-helix domain-containing protein [Virgibacillus halophilus]|uniref:Helix-turn-helix transcriptional regulator n=1 Tax=Tigheibacillus halophilus TaxID=361280 RepID=A0ABU5C3J4_9BACI|nr:helix-turn-helix transcriptional regulator [Virgibacillus halophilus]